VEESAEELLTGLKRYVGEESPEEVLARLERYAASVRTPVPIVVDASAVAKPAVDTFIPSRAEPVQPRQRFIREITPALLAVSTCTFMILVFELFDPVVAVVVAGAFALASVIGLARRMPLATAWTIGLIVAGLLIRFS
jgi:nitrate reductase NapE component